MALVIAGLTLLADRAGADEGTVSYDSYRTGWDPNEPGLAPASVSSADFGQLYATQLDGQIYAQPVTADGIVLTATENDKVYGLNPATGAIVWSRDVGPAWPASAIGCGDLTPNIGVTSTPVYDPTTATAYFTAKVNNGSDQNHPNWYLHAVSMTTGVERAGFPTLIGGSPTNAPNQPFNAKTAAQRPGLLLLGGVVYAGFASHCDYGPYVGYVVGVNASTGVQTTMWSTEAGSSNYEAGIWQSGGGLVSDGPGRIIFTTGNGVSPAPGPGNNPPSTLAESVVRLGVNVDGSLTAKDFFSPVNNTNLDTDDADLGSGGPLAIPDGYGTVAHPHLLVQVGKDGRVFLLDRDNLGGVKQGPGGTDAALQTAGPYNGVWGHPGFWGGDGGYVYTIENSGYLRAYKIGVAGGGLPTLTATGASASTWGYTSGSPVVTSTGTTSGSSLVWAVYSTGSNGSGGQLRAYDTVPINGILKLRYSVPIGTATKFAVPATDGGRVFVGTRDGVMYGFGRPTTVALSGSPTDFGSVPVGTSVTKTVTVTATQNVTVTGVSATAPFASDAASLPVSLMTGQQLSLPVTLTPKTAGSLSGALTFVTSLGNLQFDVHGSGTQPGLGAAPTSLAFGDVPVTGKVTYAVNITNTGTSPVSITGVTAPGAPFQASSLPAVGSKLAAGGSVSVPITFTPTAAAPANGSLVVTSGAGGVTVALTGTGVVGASHLTLAPTSIDFGSADVGQTVTKAFTITNTGNLVLTLTKAAPPAAPFGTSAPVSEGQQLTPGEMITQSLTFTPAKTGVVKGTYIITGDDGQGAQQISVTGNGTTPAGPVTVPPPSAGGWTLNGSASQNGRDTVLTTTATPSQAGDAIYPIPVRTAGLHVTFTAQLSGGTGADGLALIFLDPAKATSASLGRSGGELGFGTLPGVAVALDTFKNNTDPSNNFVGIALGTKADSLNYLASAPVPTSLRTGTHLVDVAVTPTGVTVRLDGGAPLIAAGAVPTHALIGFSAGTGIQTDDHVVRAVSITEAAATGPIAGLANKCVDVTGAATTDGTPLQLYTCNGSGAQTWTVSADRTLRAFGKCMDVNNGGTANGSAVQLFSCNQSSAQQWIASANGSLLNPSSGRCLDVTGGNTADGTKLQLFDCNATNSQRWNLPS